MICSNFCQLDLKSNRSFYSQVLETPFPLNTYMSRKRLLLFIMVDTITISVLSFVSRCSHLSFRSLTASLLQGMRSTGYAVPFISCWWAVIGAFRSSLFWREVVPLVVRCCTIFLLCFLIVGIHASRISIPLSLLLLSG